MIGLAPGTSLISRAGSGLWPAFPLKILSVTIFVAMSSFIKAAGDVPAGEIVFFRSFFAMFPMLVFLAWSGDLATAYKTTRPGQPLRARPRRHTAMGLGFFALTRLPLPEADHAELCPAAARRRVQRIFLGETVRVYRWSAVAVGLFGVRHRVLAEADAVAAAAWADVSSPASWPRWLRAAASAVAMLLIRNLVTPKRRSTIVFWFSTSASVFCLADHPVRLEPPSPTQATLLILPASAAASPRF